jgi:hypothetical protein
MEPKPYYIGLTRPCRELHSPTTCKGNSLSVWTPLFGALPKQPAYPFWTIRPWPQWLGLADNSQRLALLLHQLTGQRDPIYRLRLPHALLRRHIHFDGVGNSGLGRLGRCDSHRHPQARIQSEQPTAFGIIHEQTPAFPPMAPLGLYGTETPLCGDTLRAVP